VSPFTIVEKGQGFPYSLPLLTEVQAFPSPLSGEIFPVIQSIFSCFNTLELNQSILPPPTDINLSQPS